MTELAQAAGGPGTGAAATLDEARVEEFAGRLVGLYTGGMLSHLIDIGHRTGLFAALTDGPGTSADLALRATCRSGTSGSGWGRWPPGASSTTTRRCGASACRPSTPSA